MKLDTETNLNMQNSMMVFTFSLQTRKTVFGEFAPKNEDCQFKLKLETQNNSNMQNSMVMFTLPVLDWKYPF